MPKIKEVLKGVKEVAKGSAKDVIKMTTGVGKGGAAYPKVKKIMSDTGYMVKQGVKKVANKIVKPLADYENQKGERHRKWFQEQMEK
jgi:hypothetical protein